LRQIGCDHDGAPWQPVGNRCTDEQEAGERCEPGGEDEAEVGNRAGEVKDSEGDRHRHHSVTDERRHLAGVDKAKFRSLSGPRRRRRPRARAPSTPLRRT
jgi:hypothetical protein